MIAALTLLQAALATWRETPAPPQATACARVPVVTLVLWAIFLSGCSLSREQRVRTALDAFAVTAEGASHTAELVCEQRGQAVIARAADPAVPADTARAELAAVHDRCDATRSVFDVIRRLHDEAVQAVQAGALDQAEALLQELRAHWAALGGAS